MKLSTVEAYAQAVAYNQTVKNDWAMDNCEVAGSPVAFCEVSHWDGTPDQRLARVREVVVQRVDSGYGCINCRYRAVAVGSQPCCDCAAFNSEATAIYEERDQNSTSDDLPVRLVKPTTGGAKETKPERYDLIPAEALAELARLYGRGAQKYAEHNWRKGYKWSLAIAALERHLAQFKMLQDVDEETRCHHLAAVAFHAFSLIVFGLEHPELDDRYRKEKPEGLEAD